MRLVGVDPGTQVTGYGVLDVIGSRVNVLEAGEMTPRKTDKLPQRILTIYDNLVAVLEQYKPQVMVLEKLYAH